ncbi:MAG: CoA pyrophosphatase [Acidiferrobacterales bacterium]
MRELVVNRLAKSSRAGTANGPARVGDLKPLSGAEASRSLIPAAALVPLVDRPGGMTLLLTQRTKHLHDHAGQISFPGGRVEAHDESPIATALRETKEEIGLTPEFVEVVGYLDLYETGTGFLITPVVGIVSPGFTLAPDEFEVADIFEVPLSFVLDPRNHRRKSMFYKGTKRTYHVIEYRERYIWGATAGMLINLYKKLSNDPGPAIQSSP